MKTQVHLNLGATGTVLSVTESPIGGNPVDWNALFSTWVDDGKLLDYSIATPDKLVLSGGDRVSTMTGTAGGRTWTSVASRLPLYVGEFIGVPACYYDDAVGRMMTWNGTYPTGVNKQASSLALVFFETDNGATNFIIGSSVNNAAQHIVRRRATRQIQCVLGSGPSSSTTAKVATGNWTLIGGSWEVGATSSTAKSYSWIAGEDVITATGTGTTSETGLWLGNQALASTVFPLEGYLGPIWTFPIEILNDAANYATYTENVMRFCEAQFGLEF